MCTNRTELHGHPNRLLHQRSPHKILPPPPLPAHLRHRQILPLHPLDLLVPHNRLLRRLCHRLNRRLQPPLLYLGPLPRPKYPRRLLRRSRLLPLERPGEPPPRRPNAGPTPADGVAHAHKSPAESPLDRHFPHGEFVRTFTTVPTLICIVC